VNQVLQRDVVHENRARDQRSYNRFKDNNHRDRDKGNVNYMEESMASEEEGEVCVAE
jgi:hypothetical protein